MAQQIQLRRGTAATWTSANPTLAQGELGLETDTGQFKFGDGSTAWTSLAYSGLDNPMTTVGDIIVGGTVTGGIAAATRLAAGTSGDVLTCNGTGTAPSWQPPTGGGGGGGGAGLFAGGMNPASRSTAGLTTNVNQQGTFSMGDGTQTVGFYIADSMFSGGDELEGIVAAYPGSAFQLDALINIQGPTGGSPGAFGGVAIMNTTTGQTMLFGLRWSGGAWQPYVMTYNSPTSFNSSLYSGSDLALANADRVWLRLVDNGTDITCSWSLNNILYTQVYTVAKSSSFLGSGGFNYLGAVIDPVNNALAMTVESWNAA